jgi:hypothetical protein
MARGTTNDSNRNIFYAKIKGLKKEEPSPYIEISQKGNDGYVILEPCTFIEGWLSSAKVDSYLWEEKPVRTIELVLEDGIEKYIVQMSYTQLSRSLINSLLGTKDYGKLKISVYTNKAGYKSIFVENNGEKMAWKHTIEEFKAKTKEIKDEEGEVIKVSYKELDNWLEEQFKLHVVPNVKPNPNPYVAPSNTTEAPKKEEVKSESEVSVVADPSDDLPFN